MRAEMFAVSIDDNETRETIRTAYENFNLLLEPHGAVGWAGLMKDFEVNPADADPDQLTICLETAHPAKFPDEIRGITGIEPVLPDSLKYLDDREEKYDSIINDYQVFKNYLKNKY
jgi:threonine synthase